MVCSSDGNNKCGTRLVAIKRLVGVAPESRIGECRIYMPPLSVNKAAHSDFETQ